MLVLGVLGVLPCGSTPALAQDHAGHEPTPGWTFMQDGVAWVMFNAQGSPRGEQELKVPTSSSSARRRCIAWSTPP